MPSRKTPWRVELTRRAERNLRRADRSVARRILRFLARLEEPGGDPRARGGPLRGPMSALWRYRVGSYRLLCSLDDADHLILVVDVAHRSDVYR